LQVHAFSIGVKLTLSLVKLASTGTAKAAEVANELIPTAMAAVSNMAFISFPFDLANEVQAGLRIRTPRFQQSNHRGAAIRT
jgi:hypothetical protein